MVYKRFDFRLGLRLLVMFASMAALAFGLAHGTGTALLLLAGFVLLASGVSLVRLVTHTNRELESFLAGLRFGDFQQQAYTIRHLGPSFVALEKQMQVAMHKMKAQRSRKEQEAAYLQALLRNLPVPFLILKPDGRVEIMNHATRRMFNVADIAHVDQLEHYGPAFSRDIRQIEAGESLLTTVVLADSSQQYLLSATRLVSAGRSGKLVALQNVQEELDATEIAAWQDLLRVISHEILNSLAPVSSCAQTALVLVDDMLEQNRDPLPAALNHDIEDIRSSIETVHRRSEALARFIRSYRQLTRMPPPKRVRIELDDYLQRLHSLVGEELARHRITMSISLRPESLALAADRDMLDQALINLIRNATDALEDREPADIWIKARRNDKQQVVISVEDNGPGVPGHLVENVFFPFFTTKERGSGVGLALVRYIMITHGGSASYRPRPGGGSQFRLIF